MADERGQGVREEREDGPADAGQWSSEDPVQHVLDAVVALNAVGQPGATIPIVAERLGVSARVVSTIVAWLAAHDRLESASPIIIPRRVPSPIEARVLAGTAALATLYVTPVTIAQVARLLGCGRSTVWHALEALEKGRYLVRDERGRLSVEVPPPADARWWLDATADVRACARGDSSLRAEKERWSKQRQVALLEAIVVLTNELGRSPSLSELGARFGCSREAMHLRVKGLEKDGFLKRTPAGLRVNHPEMFGLPAQNLPPRRSPATRAPARPAAPLPIVSAPELSLPEEKILRTLLKAPELSASPGVLAEKSRIARGKVRPLLTSLEEKGFLLARKDGAGFQVLRRYDPPRRSRVPRNPDSPTT